MFDELLKVIYRSIKLDASLYKDPKTFEDTSLYYAALIIIFDGMAGAFAVSSIYKTNIFLTGITAVISWLVWATLIFVIGIKIFPDPGTESNFKKVLVTVGLAHAPGLLRFFAVIPDLVIPIVFFTQFWIFAALVIGVREILNFKSNFKSFGVVLIAFLIIAFISVSYVVNNLSSMTMN